MKKKMKKMKMKMMKFRNTKQLKLTTYRVVRGSYGNPPMLFW
jgi:hypothetical protein